MGVVWEYATALGEMGEARRGKGATVAVELNVVYTAGECTVKSSQLHRKIDLVVH